MVPIVETISGKVSGVAQGKHIQFRGIPFASPPINEKRFSPPEPVAPWSGVFKADQFPVAAPQEKLPLFGVEKVSDDCLYLNIWTPGLTAAKRPVMVWFHGGAFTSGTSSQIMYHGDALVETGDVILVTANYRLGAMGFVNVRSQIDNETFSSNNGLRDQVAALKWIQNNIELFGGDPDNITIFGESAGAMSVATLMAVPAAKGLFHKVISQSGSADHAISHEESEVTASAFLNAMNVSSEKDISRLFECDPADIVKAQQACALKIIRRGQQQNLPLSGMTMVPVIDGDFLPGHPIKMIEKGNADNVALMAGSNKDEWNLFLFNPFFNGGGDANKWKDISKDKCLRMLERALPDMSEQAYKVYEQFSGQKGLGHAEIFAAMETDRTFRIPTLRLSEAHAKRQQESYNYMLTWESPAFDGVMGCCHVADVPLVFGNVDDMVGQLFTGGGEGARKLSQNIMASWVNFARTGTPATGELSDWQSFANQGSCMVIGKESFSTTDWQVDCNDLWFGII